MSYRIKRLNISFDEIRNLILEYLKKNAETQYSSICNGVAQIAVNRGIAPNPQPNTAIQGATYSLDDHDSELVREIIWDLIIERILTIGVDSTNPNWPFLKLTSYGLEIIKSQKPIPHDPSGYLNRVKEEIPNIDEVIFKYLEESIHTYNIGAYLSASVTLGCASEKALLLLIESYINFIKDPTKQESFRKKVQGRMIKRQYEEFSKTITAQLSTLPKELSDNITTILLGVFEMIRNNRNDAGHPTGKVIGREQIFAYLQVFIEYCKRIYGLMDFFYGVKRDGSK